MNDIISAFRCDQCWKAHPAYLNAQLCCALIPVEIFTCPHCGRYRDTKIRAAICCLLPKQDSYTYLAKVIGKDVDGQQVYLSFQWLSAAVIGVRTAKVSSYPAKISKDYSFEFKIKKNPDFSEKWERIQVLKKPAGYECPDFLQIKNAGTLFGSYVGKSTTVSKLHLVSKKPKIDMDL